MLKIVPKFSDNGFCCNCNNDDDDDDDDYGDDDDNKANIIKQKYITLETAAQNIKNQHKFSTENQEDRRTRGNRCIDNSIMTLKYH